MSSLVAPPAGALGTQGTLAVSVKNASGGPVVNLPVAISGTASRSGVTNQEGCVVFSLIPAGTYAVTLDSAGWVDRTGTPAARSAPACPSPPATSPRSRWSTTARRG